MGDRTARYFELLIVDDEPADVELVRAAIREGHFLCRPHVARDGKDAMAFLRKEGACGGVPTPDLVLLDINMPRMNGLEVLKAMKADPALARVPVVVLTTSQGEQDIVQSYNLGAAGFVTKSIDVDKLFQAIHCIEEYWFAVVSSPLHPPTD
jgi:CheY-like chemotaxis protein